MFLNRFRLVIHNGDLVDDTINIKCPFSDHFFVLDNLKLALTSKQQKSITCRNLSLNNIQKITDNLSNKNFDFLSLIDNLDDKWLNLKMAIMNIVNEIASEKQLRLKASDDFPWHDDEPSYVSTVVIRRINVTVKVKQKLIFKYLFLGESNTKN